jgi:hypothetical protein
MKHINTLKYEIVIHGSCFIEKTLRHHYKDKSSNAVYVYILV